MAAAVGIGARVDNQSRLKVSLLPDGDCTILDLPPSCGPTLILSPTFDRQILATAVIGRDPAALILGLRHTPTVPPVTSFGGCLLQPSPDVVVLLPAPTGGNAEMVLPIERLRPLQFFGQVASLFPQTRQLALSNAVVALCR